MKRKSGLALLLFLSLIYPVEAYAQEASTAQQSVENLRSELQDVETKQAALEARLKELDEDLRPENIERSLSLTGSTRPEELRARRREQLEKERASVQSQLDQLSTSHTRLQAALSAAETLAYQQSAGVNTATTQPTGAEATQQAQPARSAQPTQPRTTRRRARRVKTRRRPQ